MKVILNVMKVKIRLETNVVIRIVANVMFT